MKLLPIHCDFVYDIATLFYERYLTKLLSILSPILRLLSATRRRQSHFGGPQRP